MHKCHFCSAPTKPKRRFCSLACSTRSAKTGRPRHDMRGPNNWNWRGGTTRTERKIAMGRTEYAIWRVLVFKRDAYLCAMCGSAGRLEANHIQPWSKASESRYDVANGISLCLDCHRSIYGREHEYEARFLAWVSSRQPVDLTDSERVRLKGQTWPCAWCHRMFRHGKWPSRRRLLHFCNMICRRSFGAAIGNNWRGMRLMIQAGSFLGCWNDVDVRPTSFERA